MTFTRKDDVFKIFRKLSGPLYVPKRPVRIAKGVDSVLRSQIGVFRMTEANLLNLNQVNRLVNNCDR
jgi:hypothetical protein